MAIYTLDEHIKMLEPQARLDKALIARCVEGLGIYAAQKAADDHFSPKIGEMRELVETLVDYWLLYDGENKKPLSSFLVDFDLRVDEAKSGGAVMEDSFLYDFNVIFGLYRYGSDMLVSQGEAAMGDILDVSERMKEIAETWDFDTAVLGDLTGRLERAVRDMLEKYPLPGQPVTGEVNAGYTIQQTVLFDNKRGFALAHSPETNLYVTWQLTNDGGKLDYYWGRYIVSEERARIDYIARVIGYKDTHRVQEAPNPTAAVEMAAEQNYNMIDGMHNNEEITPSFSPEYMQDYGYIYDGMIPLDKDRALAVYDSNRPIYLLYSDDTESMAESRMDIESFDGIFGYEIPLTERGPAKDINIELTGSPSPVSVPASPSGSAVRMPESPPAEKQSVLKQIRDAEKAPESPRKPKTPEKIRKGDER